MSETIVRSRRWISCARPERDAQACPTPHIRPNIFCCDLTLLLLARKLSW